MSAEVQANELSLDLYRIDLRQVVSKYIGETEKNLSHIFDAAEDASALLFFDEADALFGGRTQVQDSHDRHASEISYLFWRIEVGRSLVILSTSTNRGIPAAWLRRIRFAVRFP